METEIGMTRHLFNEVVWECQETANMIYEWNKMKPQIYNINTETQ
jgi:hypothetical protein